jgi:hypothetical protein
MATRLDPAAPAFAPGVPGEGAPLVAARARAIWGLVDDAYGLVARTPSLDAAGADAVATAVAVGNPAFDVDDAVAVLHDPALGWLCARVFTDARRDSHGRGVLVTDVVVLDDAAMAALRRDPFRCLPRARRDRRPEAEGALEPPALRAMAPDDEARVLAAARARPDAALLRPLLAALLAGDRVLWTGDAPALPLLQALALLLPVPLRAALTLQTLAVQPPRLAPRLTVAPRLTALLAEVPWTARLPEQAEALPPAALALADALLALPPDALGDAHARYEAVAARCAAGGAPLDPRALGAEVARLLRLAGAEAAARAGAGADALRLVEPDAPAAERAMVAESLLRLAPDALGAGAAELLAQGDGAAPRGGGGAGRAGAPGAAAARHAAPAGGAAPRTRLAAAGARRRAAARGAGRGGGVARRRGGRGGVGGARRRLGVARRASRRQRGRRGDAAHAHAAGRARRRRRVGRARAQALADVAPAAAAGGAPPRRAARGSPPCGAPSRPPTARPAPRSTRRRAPGPRRCAGCGAPPRRRRGARVRDAAGRRPSRARRRRTSAPPRRSPPAPSARPPTRRARARELDAWLAALLGDAPGVAGRRPARARRRGAAGRRRRRRRAGAARRAAGRRAPRRRAGRRRVGRAARARRRRRAARAGGARAARGGAAGGPGARARSRRRAPPPRRPTSRSTTARCSGWATRSARRSPRRRPTPRTPPPCRSRCRRWGRWPTARGRRRWRSGWARACRRRCATRCGCGGWPRRWARWSGRATSRRTPSCARCCAPTPARSAPRMRCCSARTSASPPSRRRRARAARSARGGARCAGGGRDHARRHRAAGAAAPTRDTLHLWGAPAAGKTGLLGALYATSKSRSRSAGRRTPRTAATPTRRSSCSTPTSSWSTARRKTDVRKDGYRPLEFLLRQYRRGAPSGETLRLSIVDPAGEYSTRSELGTRSTGGRCSRASRNAGGLLWLFSAGAPSSLDRLAVLRHLVALLEHAGAPQLGIPVGLCLSKVDALPPDRREAALADPRAALLEHLGATTFTWFEAACPRLRCFAISSAGTEPGRVRPVGLLPTLSWFAAEIGAAQAPAAVAPPSPDPAPAFSPDAPFATVEVPAVSRGMLGALAARLASAGMVPDANGATIAMPAAKREAPRFAPPDPAPAAPSFAPPAAPPRRAPELPTRAPAPEAARRAGARAGARRGARTRRAVRRGRAGPAARAPRARRAVGRHGAGGARRGRLRRARGGARRRRAVAAARRAAGGDAGRGGPGRRRFQEDLDRDALLRDLRDAVGESSP